MNSHPSGLSAAYILQNLLKAADHWLGSSQLASRSFSNAAILCQFAKSTI
jgi:hypothetical protein